MLCGKNQVASFLIRATLIGVFDEILTRFV